MIHYITTNGVGNAWVGNELRVLQKAGIPFRLHSLARPTSTFFSSQEIAGFAKETNYIYPISILSLLISTVSAPFLFRGRFVSALLNAFFGKRESFLLRIKVFGHFIVACHWAKQLKGQNVSHIHSQWVHACGTVGMYSAWLLGVTFSFTGHAADLFRDRAALRDKIRQASFIVCISEFHRQFFLDNGAQPEQLKIVYCGIDTSHFSPKVNPLSDSGFRILASGRLVEKKGFSYLIDACKKLADEGFLFECVISGSGPLEESLNEKIRACDLSDKVVVTGEPLLQEEIPEFMHSGSIYCLPCVWASDNDVDGLPQMLMEAMACGLPVISTRLVGIPDLVIEGATGLLVEPNDALQLAEAIKKLAADKNIALEIAENGRNYVQEKFDLRNCMEPLIDEFRKRIG